LLRRRHFVRRRETRTAYEHFFGRTTIIAAEYSRLYTFARHLSHVTAALLFFSANAAFAQGSLTPPAAPTPTMKTLDQIERRTPISTTNTSA
jgi:hypothetical protein